MSAKKKAGRPKITNPKGAGRKSVFTQTALLELKQAFGVGATDAQACFYAGIGESTFYTHCKENPEFREEMNRLKENPILKAKTNVVKEIMDGDVNVSKWFLERRAREEFATKQELEAKAVVSILKIDVVEDKEKKPNE